MIYRWDWISWPGIYAEWPAVLWMDIILQRQQDRLVASRGGTPPVPPLPNQIAYLLDSRR